MSREAVHDYISVLMDQEFNTLIEDGSLESVKCRGGNGRAVLAGVTADPIPPNLFHWMSLDVLALDIRDVNPPYPLSLVDLASPNPIALTPSP